MSSSDVIVVRARIADVARAPVLSPQEQRRAETLHPSAVAAFVAGRSLVRRLFGRWFSRGAIRIIDVPDEKPRLDRDDAELDFNVSHAGDLVIAAIARGRRVGVDVEKISRRRQVTAITEEALGAEAAEELRWIPAERRAARFTCWWVRIEAMCKVTGAGLTFPVDDTIPPGFAVRDIAMPAGYRAAVAFDAPSRFEVHDWSAA